jgi:REP element-mobilizing transposase RayT
MPRRTISFVKGNYYHIYNRGAGRQPIFREDRNYHYLLRLIEKVAPACEVTLLAYCLLPNHYHWLVRQDGDTSVGVLPKRVFGSYTQAFNKAYHASGTLFQGRFQARLVDTERYLRHLCRYIHTNPVKHGLSTSPDSWPYSNYQSWANDHMAQPTDRQFVADFFGTSAQYAAFVQAYLVDRTTLSTELRVFQESLEQLPDDYTG